MGTEMEQPSAPDKVAWSLSSPDGDGCVWIRWDKPNGEWTDANLGAAPAVAEAMADWLGRMDFEA